MELAIQMMSESSQWTENVFKVPDRPDHISTNERIAFRWVFKVLLARWTIFHTFIEVAKEQNVGGELPSDIKHDWLLFQILPSVLIDQEHPFLEFMNSCLRGMSMEELRARLTVFHPGRVLGSAFNTESDHFFFVFDEAQVAGQTHMNAFADASGYNPWPVLHPIIRACTSISSAQRFIVSGTGFSLSLFQMSLASGVSKTYPRGRWYTR
jgi:hypothetical protein